jgi:hypothetical protein
MLIMHLSAISVPQMVTVPKRQPETPAEEDPVETAEGDQEDPSPLLPAEEGMETAEGDQEDSHPPQHQPAKTSLHAMAGQQLER